MTEQNCELCTVGNGAATHYAPKLNGGTHVCDVHAHAIEAGNWVTDDRQPVIEIEDDGEAAARTSDEKLTAALDILDTSDPLSRESRAAYLIRDVLEATDSNTEVPR